MDLDRLTKNSGEWLNGRGPDADIVISSRLRLARNVEDYPFVNRATEREKGELFEIVSKKIKELNTPGLNGSGLLFYNLNQGSELDCTFLVERHLISMEHARAQGDRGVVLDPKETVSIMINEEDHLRIQGLRSGFQLEELWDEISQLDDDIDKLLPYAYHPEFGMLTACPSNVGTGMRVSVMLHLPALVMTKHIERVFHAVQKINFTVRGLYGEGTQAFGDFYQISNQVTLGRSEGEILNSMQEIIPQIVKYERNIRESLLEEDLTLIEDRVWRAFGMLKSARIISSEETMDLLSAVRMGVNLNIINELNLNTVNELFIFTQPAHLQKIEGRPLKTMERDVTRADFIRSRLN